MADSHEMFKEFVEKEKNREDLNRAIKATPIRDQWRQIIVVGLAVLIISGVFVSRTKRFKVAMNSLENSELLNKMRLGKKQPPESSRETASANSATKTASAAAAKDGSVANHNTSDDEDIAALQQSKEAVGAKLERISAGQLRMGSAEERAPNSGATEPELMGIANKTPEPELDAFQIPVTPNASSYLEIKKLPTVYAEEKQEFPGL